MTLLPTQNAQLALEQAAAELRSGDVLGAERTLNAALLINPNDPRLLFERAEIDVQRGRFEEAKLQLRRGLVAAPSANGMRIKLARLLQGRADYRTALHEVEQLPAPMLETFEIATFKAALLGALGEHDREIAIYEDLVSSNSKSAELWKSLGDALKTVGRTREGIEAIRRAIKVRPTYGEAYWTLANFKSFKFEQRDLAAMRRALRGHLSEVDQMHFHFALGKALEDRNQFEESFLHYAAGNRIRSQSLAPQQMSVGPLVVGWISELTAPFLRQREGGGNPAPDPIFIVGLQRSGSTLVEQILASHPDIEGVGELNSLQQVWEEIARSAAQRGHTQFEELAKLDNAALSALGRNYLDRAKQHRLTSKPHFVDKLPANWINVGLIRLILPNAKIIDARRHPLACGLSNFKQHYATGVTYAYNLSSIGHFYADYLRLMNHFDRIEPGAIHHLVNERLIEDPETEIQAMFDYLGIAYDAACLDFHQNSRAVRTPSAEQVRRPINGDGLNRWRDFEPWLDPLKIALGSALNDWDKV